MITKNQVVSLDYFIKDEEGNTLESSAEGLLTYIHGYGHLPIALERALEGKDQGTNVSLSLPPVQCFGEHNEDLVRVVGPEMFEEGLEIKAGLSFENMTEHGPQLIRVVKVEGNEITIDSNHPYAGLTLTWDVVVLSLRHASAEEMEQGVASGMYTDKGCGGRKSCEDRQACSTEGDSSHQHKDSCSH
ncbi:peptidylprolyl isomerase [Lentisphaera marina]|uniref:FKBP-type peptidyl-prolyl cis-trans isomerase n=1 Tax=Lentisphaera marina TaxID=1111041 RepID=UPI002366B544|nr:peptidylprolyl isomerase [Lentisphaera marina]MDD7986769.1 peptidylprolyl isomerase [Lentisphaera marina]